MDDLTPHPAKYSAGVIIDIVDMLGPYRTRLRQSAGILDPFAGIGGVHTIGDALGVRSTGFEIEPEWARQHPRTKITDVLTLPLTPWTTRRGQYDGIVTSPCYGNRMADHHEAKDDSKRHTYRHYLGRTLHEHNSGAMQWGDEYRVFHREAWHRILFGLRRRGLFVLNISNHIRDGKEQRVRQWHHETLLGLGLRTIDIQRVHTRRQRHGANGDLRVKSEYLYLYEKMREPK